MRLRERGKETAQKQKEHWPDTLLTYLIILINLDLLNMEYLQPVKGKSIFRYIFYVRYLFLLIPNLR